MNKPAYTVVWNGVGDQRYLSTERDAVRVADPLKKRGAGSRDMQGLVLAALRAATEPIHAQGLAMITGCRVSTCRVIMARAVKRNVARRAGGTQEKTRHYQQMWVAVK
jgi:hypothetical protein